MTIIEIYRPAIVAIMKNFYYSLSKLRNSLLGYIYIYILRIKIRYQKHRDCENAVKKHYPL
jgi:hypothetical protein